MAKDQDFVEFVSDQLAGLRHVTQRRMFGAVGLYHSDWFFAIVDDGRLYFITDNATRPRYEAHGMKAFMYAPGKTLGTYYEVPVDVLEDDRALCQWALEAVSVQKARSAKSPAARKPKPRVKRDRGKQS